MTMDLKLLWAVQLTPLLAFLLIQALPKTAKKLGPAIGVTGSLIAAATALALFWINRSGAALPKEFLYQWLQVSDRPLWARVSIEHYSLAVGFLVDPLNLLMISLVTTISFFVQLFSVYYMNEDTSKSRYFAFLSFFSFSMTGLVLSSNLLQTFLFWELVGLTSYLLIGFWYQKPAAATAARKAFVINRLADLGFYLGIILLFLFFGSVSFTTLDSGVLREAFSNQLLTLIGLLVFLGVMGKSAQFPFHAWLPDAMEGPTPVSALIHSATMVAAGVFLLSRAFGLFSASTITLQVILTIGMLTALIGAAVATVQRDIKKILAYSTISQLGFMVMAVGAGSSVSAMFHLTTHAFFKSLLFLTAGAFIHRFHTNDIWEIGRGGGKKETLTMAALILGLFSLCGIFPFSGFFSKDMILEVLREKNVLCYTAAIFASFLTTYYSFRLLFVISLSKIDAHEAPHAGRSPERQSKDEAHRESSLLKFCKALPLVSLGVISLVMGALGTPFFGQALLRWLGGEHFHAHGARLPAGQGPDLELLATTTALIIAGAVIAFWQFRDPLVADQKLKKPAGILRTILERKFFVDDAYEFLVKRVGLGVAWILNQFDRTVINGLMVNRTSYAILDLGKALSKLQNGALQNYLSAAIALGAVAVFILMRGKGF